MYTHLQMCYLKPREHNLQIKNSYQFTLRNQTKYTFIHNSINKSKHQ